MAKIKKFIKVTITGFIPAASSLDMDAFKLQHKKLQTARNAANETLEGVTFDVKEVNRKALADYRASKDVTDDEVVSLLIGIKDDLKSDQRNWGKEPSLGHDINLLEQAIARIQTPPNPWIKISDIPEEWKDGRRLDLISIFDGRRMNYYWDADVKGWSNGNGFVYFVDDISHAMLPPATPQQKETQ